MKTRILSRPPPSAFGSSLVPVLRSPSAPGKDHAFSRCNSMTTIRTPGRRLIDTENLTGMGFSARELVFRVVASTLPDEITIVPTTSSDLRHWPFAPLRFLDAADIGAGRRLFRYCVTTPDDPVRFFRAGSLPLPTNP